jgi:hypothetical protein
MLNGGIGDVNFSWHDFALVRKAFWLFGFATICPTSGQRTPWNRVDEGANWSIINDIDYPTQGPLVAVYMGVYQE